jgi:two-component system sensor histidine kinase YesM
MPAFFKQYGYNGFKQNYDKKLMISSYYDPTTKWTLVQESNFDKVFGKYYSLAAALLCILVIFQALGFIISLAISRFISKPLNLFAEKLHMISTANFEKIKIQNTYEEVYTISLVYNEMVDKIENLITKIKEEEKIKRQHELNFLQLQINPHFMHNTLFSVKCLVEMGQSERAAKMLASFMHILRQPIAVENELISIKNEIGNLQNYTTLMSFRYENIRLNTYLEETTENCLIPRLLLQPIVENSIFHGLDEDNGDFVIELFAFYNDDKLIIKIRDNGVGMTKEELSRVWMANNKTDRTFNNIGLKNVRDRIKIIYGDDCGLKISSTKGEGTEVELSLRKALPELK